MFLRRASVFAGSYWVGIPMVSCLQRHVAFHRITDSKMEVTTHSLHEQLGGELGKFRKFQRIGLFEILSQIGKGGGY